MTEHDLQHVTLGARITRWLFLHQQWVEGKQILDLSVQAGFSRASGAATLRTLVEKGTVLKEGRVGSNGKGGLWYRWNEESDPRYLQMKMNKWWDELPEIPVCWPDGSPAKRVEPLPALAVKKSRRRG